MPLRSFVNTVTKFGTYASWRISMPSKLPLDFLGRLCPIKLGTGLLFILFRVRTHDFTAFNTMSYICPSSMSVLYQNDTWHITGMWRSLSAGKYCTVVWQKGTSLLPLSSEEKSLPWKWKQLLPLNHWCPSTKLHGFISEKAATIIVVAVCFEQNVFWIYPIFMYTTVLLSLCILLFFSLYILLFFSLYILLFFFLCVLLFFSLCVLLFFSLCMCITVLLFMYITVLLFMYITVLLFMSITILSIYISVLLYMYITVLFFMYITFLVFFVQL